MGIFSFFSREREDDEDEDELLEEEEVQYVPSRRHPADKSIRECRSK